MWGKTCKGENGGKMSAAAWNRTVLLGTALMIAATAAVNIVIDPFWHYHGPLRTLQYPLNEQRYQNDGIARHCDYGAVIAGTSMTENFSASQFERLWGERAVKLPTSGATYREVSDQLERAFSYNDSIRYVLRSMDGSRLIYAPDEYEYADYPEYLYDRNPFNDVQYVLNKAVLPQTLAVLNYTRAGNTTPTMDEYSSWSRYAEFGAEAVMAARPQLGEFTEEQVLTQEDLHNIQENVEQNILRQAREHPEITFYVFLPPYSIFYWEALFHTKQLHAQLEAEQLAVGILTQADNIHVFDFSDQLDMIADLNNYSDTAHYGEWVNERIMDWMYTGEHELTAENYRAYFQMLEQLYSDEEVFKLEK